MGSANRILYVVTSDISARFLRGQLAFLQRRGWDVHVATSRSDPPSSFDEGVTVHHLDFVREPSPLKDLRALFSAMRLMRDLRPSVVNASTPKAGLIGMLAARACRVRRRIYVVRGLRFETVTGRRRWVLRALERAAASCATDVVFNSRSLLEVATRERVVMSEKGRVIGAGSGNGIDTSRFADVPARAAARAALSLPVAGHVVGFVGRLTRDKGIVDLVEAFDGVPHLSVLIVGDYESGDPVPQHTRETIGASPTVMHLPWMDNPLTAYAAMDVLAFPSYREGLPNVPLEAQLCGVPVVAYAATGTVDAVVENHGGTLVPVGDVAALRQRVTELMDDESRRRELGAKASAWVRAAFDQRLVWDTLHELSIGRGPMDRR